MESYRELALRYLKLKKFRILTIITGVIISVSLITGIFTLFNVFRSKVVDIYEHESKTHLRIWNINSNEALDMMNNIKIEKSTFNTYVGRILSKKEGNDGTAIIVSNLQFGELEKNYSEVRSWQSAKEIGDMTVPEWFLVENNYEIGQEITINYETREGEEKNLNGKIVDINALGDIRYYADNSFIESLDKVDIYLRYKNIKDLDQDINVNFPEKFKYTIGLNGITLDSDWSSENNPQIQLDTFYLSALGVNIPDKTMMMFKSVVSFLIFLVIICSVGLIYNGFMININDRVKEFALLRAVGISKKQIRNILIIEAIFIGMIGIILGVASGMFGIYILVKVLNKINLPYIGAFTFVVSYGAIVGSVLVSIITIIISMISPLRKVNKISPVEGMKSCSITREKTKATKRTAIFNKFFGGRGYLANKNIKRNRGRSRSIIFGFSLSIFIFVSFNPLINNFNRISSLEKGRKDTTISVNREADIEKIKAIQGVKHVYIEKYITYSALYSNTKPIKSILTEEFKKIATEPYTEFISVDYEIAKDEITKDNNLTEEKYKNGIIIYDKALILSDKGKEEVDITKYKVGDKIDLELDYLVNDNISEVEKDTVKKTYILKDVEIVGVISDPIVVADNFAQFKIYIGENVIKTLEENVGATSQERGVDLVVPEDGKLQTVLNELNENKEYYNISNVEDPTANTILMDKFILIGNIGVYGFLTLITLITVANILASVSANINSRRKEIALIRSVGASKSFIRKSLIVENLNYFFYSILYGGTLGVMSSIIINNLFAQNYKIIYMFPYKSLIIAAIMLIVVVTLINQYTIKQLCEKNIVDEIREE